MKMFVKICEHSIYYKPLKKNLKKKNWGASLNFHPNLKFFILFYFIKKNFLNTLSTTLFIFSLFYLIKLFLFLFLITFFFSYFSISYSLIFSSRVFPQTSSSPTQMRERDRERERGGERERERERVISSTWPLHLVHIYIFIFPFLCFFFFFFFNERRKLFYTSMTRKYTMFR